MQTTKNLLFANIERITFLLSSSINILFLPRLFGIELYGDFGYLSAIYTTGGSIVFLSIREYMINKYELYNSKIRATLILIIFVLSVIVYFISILGFNNFVYLNKMFPILILLILFRFIQIYRWQNELDVDLILLSKLMITNTISFFIIRLILIFYVKSSYGLIYSIYIEYLFQLIIILLVNKNKFVEDISVFPSVNINFLCKVFLENVSLYFLFFIVLISLKFEIFYLKPNVDVLTFGEYSLANKIIEVFNFIPMLIISISYSRILKNSDNILSSSIYRKAIASLSIISFCMMPVFISLAFIVCHINNLNFLHSPYSLLMLFYALVYPIKIHLLTVLRHYTQSKQLKTYIKLFIISSLIQIGSMIFIFDTFGIYTIIISNVSQILVLYLSGILLLHDFKDSGGI